MRTSPPIVTVSLNPAIDRVIEVDSFAVGSHRQGRELLLVPAGKGINVSRALAKLGCPSIATGLLGQENRAIFGPVFRGGRIADQFITLPGRTRENITITDRRPRRPPGTARGGRDTHIRLAGLAVDRAGLRRLRATLYWLTTHKGKLPGVASPIVIFSGSLPPGIRPRVFAGLVDLCLRAGSRVAVDTSGPALAAMAGKPLWLVKPNAEELSQLVGRELRGRRDRLAAARKLSRRIPHVILTAGGEGAWLFAKDGDLALHAVAPVDPRKLHSTVGCGDALLGAYVAGIVKCLDPRESFLRAVACAAASAMTPGPADFDPAVAKSLRRKVGVSALA